MLTLERERAALEAVLASERFSRSPRLARLLAYLCQKCFEGQGDQIKEYNIATEVLGRPADFDPSQDAIARVEAHRLRKKLKEYYTYEGARDEIRIVLSPGNYVPLFLPARGQAAHLGEEGGLPSVFAERSQHEAEMRDAHSTQEAAELPPQPALPNDALSFEPVTVTPVSGSWRRWHWTWVALTVGLAIASGAVWFLSHKSAAVPVSGTLMGDRLLAAAGTGPGIRLLAGLTKGGHVDRMGNTWLSDRFYTGGATALCPHEFLGRTNDPMLFQSFRLGEFSYAIPLAPGTYELHLFFVETTYGPGMTTGGGENSRTFLVRMNGETLLDGFDIISDARGPNIADERVFRDVHPAQDGKLHLEFYSQRSQAIISAIEILPGLPNRQLPIRLVAQETSVTDHEGRVWSPDTYYSGGQNAIHHTTIAGIADPDLYAGERYGNFSYAIPTDTRDRYTATLYLAEAYWGGPQDATHGGEGSRIFNLDCNGVRLLENFDIYKQVGGMHALIKTFRHLKPNAQGKLVLSFEPVVNYASIYALEVEDEGP